MKILIIPAAGQGQRFKDEGYVRPKPLIDIRNPSNPYQRVPMVVAAGAPFYVWTDKVVLIVPKSQVSEYLGNWDQIYFDNVSCMAIQYQQEGAALTVLALLGSVPDDAEVMIVNSDQFFTAPLHGWFDTLQSSAAPDGSMLTFEVEDEKDLRWSYAQTAPHNPGVVTRVAEKQRISSHATAGAYYFRQWRVLRTAICRMVAEGERYNGEFYLAPVYNQLIKAGMTVTRWDVTGGMVCVGTPEQLRAWEQQE